MGILRETIRPSSDLRNKYPEISKTLQLKDEAAIITVNGRGDTVSLGYNTYNMLKSKIELLSSLVEGQNDIIQGRTTTLDEAFNSIDKMLDQMGYSMKSQPYTIIPTEKFNKELHQQILYIAMQFSKETAIQVKENIQNSISNLMNHPYMGTTPKIRALNDSDFRMLILEKLIIFYTVVEETRTIYLISILDQRQDYVNILNGL